MGTYADIDRASTFFIIGSNTSEAHPVLFRRIARRKQNEPGVKIIVADPRRTNTSRIADLHIAFRPGTDLALMNGMAWVILHEELDNPRFYNKYAIFKTNDGKDATFDDYRAFLEDYTPDKVAKLCNIPEQQVWEAGRLFAESPATMSLWCMGINQRIRGVWANNLIHNLHLITGQICRPGATSFSLTGQPNACGGVRDTGSLSHLLPAGRVVANKAHRNQMEAFWGIPQDSMSPNVGYHTIALFEALGKADVKAIIICETNPAHTLPNLNKVHKAMSNPDTFITVIEAFPDAVTLEYADLILAARVLVRTRRHVRLRRAALFAHRKGGRASGGLPPHREYADRIRQARGRRSQAGELPQLRRRMGRMAQAVHEGPLQLRRHDP